MKKLSRPDNKKTRRIPSFERLEDRCLLDAAPTQFGSADAFIQFLRDTALTNYKDLFGSHFQSYGGGFPGGGGGVLQDITVPGAFTNTLSLAKNTSPLSFSTTNVQVAGVDEGDIIKTDGNFIYDVSRQELVIIAASPSDMHIVSRTTIEGSPIAEYLDGNRLTVISTIYDYNAPVIPLVRSADGFPLVYPSNSKIKLTELDVSNHSAPQLATATYMDGSYLTSRAIGSRIYIVAQNYFAGLPAPAFTVFNREGIYETRDSYLARITGNELQLSLPHFYTPTGDPKNPLQAAGLVPDPAKIFKPRSANDYNLLTVAVFDDTSNTAGPVNSVSVMSSYASTVYASLTHLYVSIPRWNNNGSGGSEILQFTLNDTQVNLTADGVVPGQVIDQFSMDEQGQYFRIVTTANWGANAVTNLYVFTANGGTLDLVGSVGPLAPGEAERTARFLGDKAFIVTFREFDPLFAVDLSNPSIPRSVGELHFPGVNSYLQPIDNTHLLGVGRTGPYFGQLTLSLYDVSNLSSPRLVDHYDIAPQGWNWWWGSGSEAEWDHHALGFFPETNTLAIPIYGTYTWTNYTAFESSLWVFHMDAAKGFQVLGQVNHDSQVRRSVRINNQLYSVADDSIAVHPLQNPKAPGLEVRIHDDPRFPNNTQLTAVQNVGFSGDVLNFKVTDATGLEATIDWGDGQNSTTASQSPGTIRPDEDEANRFIVSGSHTYTKLGSFYLTVSFARNGTKLTTLYTFVEVISVDAPNLHFVNQLYHDLLHRDVDNVGLAYFGQLIQQHALTRAQAVSTIENSTEYRTNQVENLYTTLLGRAADTPGLISFVSFLQNGGTLEQAMIGILDSQEYFQHAGASNAGFLNSLYHDVLNRGIDTAGAAGWGAFLALGGSRAQLAALVLTSAEAEQDAVLGFYQQSLHRAADPAGETGFTNALRHGISQEEILAIIMGSAEYFGL